MSQYFLTKEIILLKRFLDLIGFIMSIIKFMLLVSFIILAYPFYRKDISEIIKAIKDEFHNRYSE